MKEAIYVLQFKNRKALDVPSPLFDVADCSITEVQSS